MQDARQLINIFLLAWKNYGLYPEDHTSTLKSFENLIAAFSNFFSTHGDLRLTVEKDRLLCESEPIHVISPDAPAEELITLLYRDGIKWLEFQEGLSLEELAAFFRIVNKYRSFAEETEGDIVTALMDEELEYIDFKAVDIFWQDLLLMDFSQLPPPAPRQEEVAEQEDDAGQNVPEQSGPEREEPYAVSIADPSIGAARLELSNGDYRALRQMVEEEESWDITEDLFDLLLIILKNQTGREQFTAVLGFVSEVAVESIGLEKFALLVKLFQELDQLSGPETSREEDWRKISIERFFQDLSRPEIFQLFRDNLLKLNSSEIEKLTALERILRYFSPEVIPFLAPVLIRSGSPAIRRVVSEVIVELSLRDLAPLERIADRHGAEMGEELLLILNRLEGERVNEILFRMCNHPSDRVRRKAIEELLDRDPKYAQRLFALIDDPSQGIRTSLLAAFAKHRSGPVETLLLNYLQDNFAREDPGHILACYKALGRCGSDRALPFLRGVLLDRGWNSFIGSGKLIFREGAAAALALLDTPAARDVLRKAARSRFRVIRNALAGARTITASGENPR